MACSLILNVKTQRPSESKCARVNPKKSFQVKNKTQVTISLIFMNMAFYSVVGSLLRPFGAIFTPILIRFHFSKLCYMALKGE